MFQPTAAAPPQQQGPNPFAFDEMNAPSPEEAEYSPDVAQKKPKRKDAGTSAIFWMQVVRVFWVIKAILVLVSLGGTLFPVFMRPQSSNVTNESSLLATILVFVFLHLFVLVIVILLILMVSRAIRGVRKATGVGWLYPSVFVFFLFGFLVANWLVFLVTMLLSGIPTPRNVHLSAPLRFSVQVAVWVVAGIGLYYNIALIQAGMNGLQVIHRKSKFSL